MNSLKALGFHASDTNQVHMHQVNCRLAAAMIKLRVLNALDR